MKPMSYLFLWHPLVYGSIFWEAVDWPLGCCRHSYYQGLPGWCFRSVRTNMQFFGYQITSFQTSLGLSESEILLVDGIPRADILVMPVLRKMAGMVEDCVRNLKVLLWYGRWGAEGNEAYTERASGHNEVDRGSHDRPLEHWIFTCFTSMLAVLPIGIDTLACNLGSIRVHRTSG